MDRRLKERVREIGAIIFDLDDTLVESKVDFPKFKRLVIERIISYGEDARDYNPNETVVSTVNRFEGRMIRNGVPDLEIKRRLAELDKIMDAVEMEKVTETRAYDGAVRLLSILRENGIKIGILTRGCNEYANSVLARTNLAGLIDAIECRNPGTKAKPNPEAYLKLAKALEVGVDETIFVGDHPLDGQCAANAGVPFIAVLTGDVPEEALLHAGALQVFADVDHLATWLEDALRE